MCWKGLEPAVSLRRVRKEVGQSYVRCGAALQGRDRPRKVAQLVDEGFIPIISEMPGFVAYYLVNAGTA